MEQKRIANMQLNHLGIIFSNLSFLGFVLIITAIFFYLFYAFLALIMIIPVILTFGLIMFSNPDYFSWLSGDSAILTAMNGFITYLPSIAIATVAGSVLSLLCLSFYKGQKSWWRIVLSIIIIVLSLLVAIGIIGA